ncbi:FUSC family protein [Streptomyces tsukubensis]|nr:FUSC family protein [Streptomyces tsukubensis]QFR97596.1 FUSC family protein [Streptomyces tsukubensis]
MARGALSVAPLIAAVAEGRPTAGVLAALGVLLATVNDRPGSRRAATRRLGAPAVAGAAGLFVGSYAAALTGAGTGAVVLPLVLAVLGLCAGAISALGPVASACGTQLLVAAAIGAGMPLPEPGWLRALYYLAGAGWLLALRLALPSPGGSGAKGAAFYRLGGERAAVAAVYAAVADLLTAAGSPDAPARRVALTTALDQAQEALFGRWLGSSAASAAERRLHGQFAAALPLAEAATALAWAGAPLPARAAEGPRRLAEAVRAGERSGPLLPAPARTVAGLRALDDALLAAAEAFDREAGGPARPRRGSARSALGRMTGPAGREYGVRVALCFGASAAAAQALHPDHWYWLPATAAFLVKPDLGPLASRVLCRALGTVLGAGLFAAAAALAALSPVLPPRAAVLVTAVAVCGALLPLAMRHFASQTMVVTGFVLALVLIGGEEQASWTRIADTLLACGTVLLVGHLPFPGQRGNAVRTRLAAASLAADDYLGHVLSGSRDRPGRWALRREAYRSLAEASTAVELSAAELPALARHTAGAADVTSVLERLVDTTTAAAVDLDDAGRLPARHSAELAVLRAELAALDRFRVRPTAAGRSPVL